MERKELCAVTLRMEGREKKSPGMKGELKQKRTECWLWSGCKLHFIFLLFLQQTFLPLIRSEPFSPEIVAI